MALPVHLENGKGVWPSKKKVVNSTAPPVQSATDIPHHCITQDLALQNEDLKSIANPEAVPFTAYYLTQLV
jgi:hypothetical protein